MRSSVRAADNIVPLADVDAKSSASARISSAIRRHQQTLAIVPETGASDPPKQRLNAFPSCCWSNSGQITNSRESDRKYVSPGRIGVHRARGAFRPSLLKGQPFDA